MVLEASPGMGRPRSLALYAKRAQCPPCQTSEHSQQALYNKGLAEGSILVQLRIGRPPTMVVAPWPRDTCRDNQGTLEFVFALVFPPSFSTQTYHEVAGEHGHA